MGLIGCQYEITALRNGHIERQHVRAYGYKNRLRVDEHIQSVAQLDDSVAFPVGVYLDGIECKWLVSIKNNASVELIATEI